MASSHGNSLKKSLRAIERAFADVDRSIAALAKRARSAEREAARTPKVSTRRRRIVRLTPKRRAQLKLQGAYMGYVRQLKPVQKARVKAVKAKRGFEAAIRAAKRIAIQLR